MRPGRGRVSGDRGGGDREGERVLGRGPWGPTEQLGQWGGQSQFQGYPRPFCSQVEVPSSPQTLAQARP